MEQTPLFVESLTEALKATVASVGGAKFVASSLWPEKSLEEANRHLLDCLNPDRAARLDPEKLLLLLKLARAKGVHLAMTWILEDVGYAAPQPIEPEDQEAEQQRQFISAVERLEALAKRMDRTRLKAVG
jgi:glutamyl/glutaminyl-tRNA synthetase